MANNTANATEKIAETSNEVPFSQSRNIIDDIVDMIKKFIDDSENISKLIKKEDEDKEPLINDAYKMARKIVPSNKA